MIPHLLRARSRTRVRHTQVLKLKVVLGGDRLLRETTFFKSWALGGWPSGFTLVLALMRRFGKTY